MIAWEDRHVRGALSDSPDSSVGKDSACNAGNPGSSPGSKRSPGEGIGYPLQYSWASLVGQLVRNLPTIWETWLQPLGWDDPLEKEKATHSSILAWRIPWTVQSLGSQRVGHNSGPFTFTFIVSSHQPNPSSLSSGSYPLSPTQLLPSFTPFQSRRSSLLAWKYVFTSPIFRIMLSKQNQNLLQAHVPFHLLLHIFFLNKIQHQNCLSLPSFFFKSNFSTSNFS